MSLPFPTKKFGDLANITVVPGTGLIAVSDGSGFSKNVTYDDFLATSQLLSGKNVANGYAGLDGSSLIAESQIPTLPQSKITNLVSDLAARELLANKVTVVGTPGDDTNYPTEKAVRDALDLKEDSLGFTPENVANKVTVVGTPGDDTNYPSEQAVREALDLKEDSLGFTPEDAANKGAASGYAGLDSSSKLLLVNFPSGSALEVLRRNAANDELEFANVASGITTINGDPTAAQVMAEGDGIGIVDAGATHTFSVDATVARDTDNLSFFASTTSAQLAGVISDETGTGLLVFGTNAVLITPTIPSFVNATHDHSDAAGGGQLTNTALTSGVFPAITGIGVQTQALNQNNFQINNLAAGTAPGDAVNFQQLQDAALGADWKSNAQLATTANITLAGEQTIDGVLTSTSRVLVKDQTTAQFNGLYDTSAGAWTRTTDADTGPEIDEMAVFIEEGTLNASSIFLLITPPPIVLDTTPLEYIQFSGATIVAGAGLTRTGNTIDAVGTTNRILVNANDIDISPNYVGQASITTLGTITTGVWNGTAITGANINAASTDLTDSANLARNTNNLSFFSATTSAQLAGVISDETGTGLLVFGTSPVIITPTIASFANATHDHSDAAGGGQLSSTTALSDSANLARNTNTLGFFASTTSAQLLAVISDETGTGALVFNNTPTLLTPTIASFANATHNHEDAAGGGTLIATNALTATGTKDSTTFLRGDDTWSVPAGTGDMVLAAVQTVTGAKTYNDATLLLRNVANDQSATFTNTNTGDRIYTLPDASGTVALTSDLTAFFDTAGTGLTSTGTTVNVNGTTNRISVDATSVDIDAAYVGQASITTLGTITTGVWNGTDIAIANIENGTANQIIKTNAGGTALEFGLIGDANTATFTTTKISTLSKSLLNASIAYIDQANVWGAFDQNIAATGKWQEGGVDISPIGLHDISFDAGGIIPVTSEAIVSRIIGAGINRKSASYVPFLTAVDSFAVVKFKLPETWNNGTITAVINWTSQTEGTGDVVWGVSGVAVGDGDNLAGVGTDYGTEITVTDAQSTVNFSQDAPRTAAITLANTPAAGDMIYLKIQRRGADVADDFGQEAQLLNVSVQLTTDKAVSP